MRYQIFLMPVLAVACSLPSAWAGEFVSPEGFRIRFPDDCLVFQVNPRKRRRNVHKRMTTVALLAGLLGLTYTTSALAADNQVRLVGTLAKIDGKKLTIASTTDKESKPTVVTCNDSTKVRRDVGNAVLKLADLKVGQTVRVYYIKSNNIATAVNIARPGSK